MHQRMPYIAGVAVIVAVAITIAAYAAFASGNDSPKEAVAPTPTTTATTQPTSTPPSLQARPTDTPVVPPTATAPAVQPPAVTPPAATPPPVQPSPTPSADPARKRVLAPIESAEVVRVNGARVLRVQAGLPSGCARADGYEVTGSGDTIQVRIYNTLPASDTVICTAIYGIYDLDVPLGNLTAGLQYRVVINNDRSLSFTN